MLSGVLEQHGQGLWLYIWIGRMGFVILGRVSFEEGRLIACVAAYSPFPTLSCTRFRLCGYTEHTHQRVYLWHSSQRDHGEFILAYPLTLDK